MKTTRFFAFAAALLMLFTLSSCMDNTMPEPSQMEATSQAEKSEIPSSSGTDAFSQEGSSAPSLQAAGQIYLYGEAHGQERIEEKKFSLWNDYYHNQGMRHLFIEYSYFTAEYLNLWMHSDGDELLDAVYDDWAGAQAHVPCVKEFYQKIKNECPETVFHGTDVGHQYDTTGVRYLKYLEQNGLKDSEKYKLAREGVAQGQTYYQHSGDAFRENMMAQNFAREFDKMDGQSIVGFYGAGHTYPDAMDSVTQSVPCMANQLKALYGDTLHTEDLSLLPLDIEPLKIDTIAINGKEYQAAYFGQQVLPLPGYICRDFWRLEYAYEDFNDKPKTNEVLPYSNYLMPVETGQVFVIDYTLTDGTVVRKYYRSDGNEWNGSPTTEEFTVE